MTLVGSWLHPHNHIAAHLVAKELHSGRETLAIMRCGREWRTSMTDDNTEWVRRVMAGRQGRKLGTPIGVCKTCWKGSLA